MHWPFSSSRLHSNSESLDLSKHFRGCCASWLQRLRDFSWACFTFTSVLAETSSSSTHLASQAPSCQGEPGLRCSSGPLEEPSVDGMGCAPGHGLQMEGGLDRRLQLRLDNMTVVSYINRQGGLSSRRLFILAKRLLRWAQHNLRSLRAMHVQGELNLGADMQSRSNVPSDEWTLHPQTVQETWGIFGRPEVDLFASEDNKGQGCVGPQLAQPPPLCFSPITLIPQVIRRIREQKHRVLLVAPLWRSQHWFAELARLLTAAPWLIPLR